MEAILKEQPENYLLIGALAFTDMGLGDKTAALNLIENAMARNPSEQDAVFGLRPLEIFARVAATAGESDRAIEAIEKLLRTPYGGVMRRLLPLTPALLRLDPMFDPLRSDPRFQKLAGDVAPPAVPPKSIAVLPFQNLSEDKANEYFADGVQDQILTDLAKVADLKVISRTSVMQYKTASHNLREIARELGVAHVLEGTVQRSANRVRVNAQLINAQTDTHLWGETYDRDLADVFAIQSEIAKRIVDQLQVKLSPREKAAIEQPPTSDLTAYDLYIRAKSLHDSVSYSASNKHSLLQAADLLDQAVARDPSFFDAYCWLVRTHGSLYIYGLDHGPERLALAETALKAAFRLQPDSAEAHLERARHLYVGYLDYKNALAELEIARKTLPNDPRIFELTGYIRRRQGYLDEGVENLERALTLDPRNLLILQQISLSYEKLRRYAEMAAMLDRALAIKPDDVVSEV
ncbi:MAG: FlgO family outer membrane protein, partial [Gemmatimonadaceae bacterium]